MTVGSLLSIARSHCALPPSRPAQDAAQNAAQDLAPDLAAHGPSRLFGHHLHHALTPLRTPQELIQRSARRPSWLINRGRFACRRRGLRSARLRPSGLGGHRTLVQNFVGGFSIHPGVVFASDRAPCPHSSPLFGGNGTGATP